MLRGSQWRLGESPEQGGEAAVTESNGHVPEELDVFARAQSQRAPVSAPHRSQEHETSRVIGGWQYVPVARGAQRIFEKNYKDLRRKQLQLIRSMLSVYGWEFTTAAMEGLTSKEKTMR